MANSTTSRSDVLEREYESELALLFRAGGLLVVSLILLYFFGKVLHSRPLGIVALCGVAFAIALGALGGWRAYRMRSLPSVTIRCPYCDRPLQFIRTPKEDFDCDHCYRHVQFENGVMVPIKMITCAFCKTVHKVSAKATHFTCDSCNRALRLTDPADPVAEPEPAYSESPQNYDVLLTDVGRQRNEVAMALESILVCNMVEAKHQMEHLPLTLVRNVPERKADAIRRRLREVGATAMIQPSGATEKARVG